MLWVIYTLILPSIVLSSEKSVMGVQCGTIKALQSIVDAQRNIIRQKEANEKELRQQLNSLIKTVEELQLLPHKNVIVTVALQKWQSDDWRSNIFVIESNEHKTSEWELMIKYIYIDRWMPALHLISHHKGPVHANATFNLLGMPNTLKMDNYFFANEGKYTAIPLQITIDDFDKKTKGMDSINVTMNITTQI